MRPALAASVLIFMAAGVAAQQASAPAPTQPPAASIEGLVVSAEDGTPLKKARVSLAKVEVRQLPKRAVTDEQGKFIFKDVEPGRYRLAAERNGYARQTYGSRGARDSGAILTVEAGRKLRDINFRLLRAGVITGRVVDEDGEPVVNVQVMVMQYRYVRNQRQLAPMGGSATNDLGEFRVHGLRPGTYYLRAEMFMGGFFGGGGAVVAGRDGSDGDQGYAPTYYPGTWDAAQAIPIQVRAADEVRADFTFVPTRTARIRGRVINSIAGGGSGRETMVLVAPRERAFMAFNTVVDEKGGFEIGGVAPGSYVVTARWMDQDRWYTARQEVEVAGEDVEGITLVIAPGVNITGRVHIEGDAGALQPSDLRVFLESQEPTMFGTRPARVEEDGSFKLENVSEGAYRISVGGMGGNAYLKSARHGNADVLEEELHIVGGKAPGRLEVVISTRSARVEGAVVKDARPFTGAVVVLVPEGSRRKQRQLFKTTNTDQNGRFELRGVAPGRYKLFAWEEIEPGAYQDPEFLRPFESRGQEIEVMEGGQAHAQLAPIPAEETVAAGGGY